MNVVDSRVTPNQPARHSARQTAASVRDYISIARPDHWFKNVFMVIGVLLAYLYYPHLFDDFVLGRLLWAIVSVCLIASSNYVINEILDASTDRSHPVKYTRPIAAGRVSLPLAYMEWLLLGMVGAILAFQVNTPFFLTEPVAVGDGPDLQHPSRSYERSCHMSMSCRNR